MIDEIVAAGMSINGADAEYGRQALRLAAQNGRPKSVRRLLEHGADPNLKDEHSRTALDLCQPDSRSFDGPGHEQVDAILRDATNRSLGGE